MKKALIIIGVLVIIVIIGISSWAFKQSQQPGELDALAQCLADKDALFYGTFWCPYCKNQKAMFGKSAKLLPYIECSTPDGKSQLSICSEQNITGYPTWEFSDGSRETGVITLEHLSEKTGCPLTN